MSVFLRDTKESHRVRRLLRLAAFTGAFLLLAAVGVLPADTQLARLPGVVSPSDGLVGTDEPLIDGLPRLNLDVLEGPSCAMGGWCDGPWCWQVLPDGIMYKAYLAGVKESRLSARLTELRHDGWMFDGNMGGRFGVLRYGNQADVLPQGFQFDIEASAQVRLDLPEARDVRSTDYRVGGLLAFGYGMHQTKFACYHLSSHLGDEFLLKNFGFPRLNYSRDVLVVGHSIYLREDLRVYAEAGWGFCTDVSEPWEFQFGVEYAPARPTGFRGAPFFAVNGHLREEVNFSGNIVVQTGWAWRSDANGRLLRLGFHYGNGESSQYSFSDDHEEQFGFGAWYDW